MAYEDLRPSAILTRASFLNAIRLPTAICGSSNAQPHIMAMARHAGVDLAPRDLLDHGYDLPPPPHVQPAGTSLGERFLRAGGQTGCTEVRDRGCSYSYIMVDATSCN